MPPRFFMIFTSNAVPIVRTFNIMESESFDLNVIKIGNPVKLA